MEEEPVGLNTRKPKVRPNVDPTYTRPEFDPNCLCNGENFCFRGIDDYGEVQRGRPFDCALYAGLAANGLLERDAQRAAHHFDTIDPAECSPVFVSAVSSNHMGEMRVFVRNISAYYPRSKFLIFDIGLAEWDLVELKGWCNVEYRRFDFAAYPPHVAQLRSYAFKLAIIEALQEHKTFFFFDASIRLTAASLGDFIRGAQDGRLLPQTAGLFTVHSVFAATHPAMYRFLPLPLLVAQVPQLQATAQFVSDSPYTRHVLKWYLCAMTPECIAPPGSTGRCRLQDYADRHRTYMKCHRFDQSLSDLIGLSFLYGEQRGALKMGYTTRNWTFLDEKEVVEIDWRRRQALQSFFSTLRIKRRDVQLDRLELPCGPFSGN
ncbi:hypothetical protein M3Y99_00145100 [Aphelenchoides fujianensis]|nr:hypothetical protein M3Y99_00145100 [Aphelenchoides fujianensis]